MGSIGTLALKQTVPSAAEHESVYLIPIWFNRKECFLWNLSICFLTQSLHLPVYYGVQLCLFKD